MSPSRRKFLGTVTAAGVVGLAGCPDGDDGGTPTDATNGTATGTATETQTQSMGDEETVSVGSVGDQGSILVDSEGMTLYMFTEDTQGGDSSACTGGCAESWPPLTVESEGDLQAGGGVGTDLGTIERSDGSLQVTANGYPLYLYAQDEESGDANGVGVNESWYPVSWEGEPLVPSNATVGTTSSDEHGTVLIGPDGGSLYQFDEDTQGGNASACTGDCTDSWSPLTVQNRGELEVGENVTADVATIQRSDGSLQVAVNGWPVYRNASDQSTGDTTGQGANGIWWLLNAGGQPLRTNATVQVGSHNDHGDILVNTDGMTLYKFDEDSQGAGTSACPDVEGCSDNWTPLTVDSMGAATAGADVTASVSTFEREDGSIQVTANGWPLYTYNEDSAAGDAAGQALNEVWWVLDPAGEAVAGGTDFESVEDGVTQTNEIIEEINEGDASITAYNEQLEADLEVEFEPVATIDPVEASNAEEAAAESERLLQEIDRVESEAISTLVEAINEQADFEFVAADTDTPEEARSQADSVEAMSQPAADGLRAAAALAESVRSRLEPAAEGLADL